MTTCLRASTGLVMQGRTWTADESRRVPFQAHLDVFGAGRERGGRKEDDARRDASEQLAVSRVARHNRRLLQAEPRLRDA